jgi:hypothetical protein
MAYFALHLVITAVSVWLSIKLVDRRNRKNTFGRALAAAAVFAVAGLVPFLPGLAVLVFSYFLLQHYDMGIPEIMFVVMILLVVTVGPGLLQMHIVTA